MKPFLPLFLLFVLAANAAFAQCTDSLIGGGGTSSDYTSSAVMDAAENLYTTGSYDTSASFADTTVLAGSLRYGVFLNKYDANRQFLFLKRIARAKKGFPQAPLIAGSGNNLFVFGRSFNDTLAVNGTNYLGPTAGNRYFFLIHTDTSLAITWVKTFRYKDNLSTTTGFALAADTAGNVYISGTFTDTMRVGTALLGTPGNVGPAVFLAKINKAGTVLWARQSASSGTAYEYVQHMHLSNTGQIVVGGRYHSSLSFGSNTAGSTPATPVAAAPFILAYDTAGAFSWMSAATIPGGFQSTSMASTADANDNTYVTGYLSDTVNFGGGTKLTGTNDMYLAKYSPTGTLIWAKKKAGHVGTNGIETGTGLVVNHAGHLIMTGIFTDSTYFGSTRYLSVGDQDFFIADYDSSGVLQRVNTYGSAKSDEADCPLLHADDSVIVSGVFSGPLLNMNGRTRLNTGAGSDVFWYDRCAPAPLTGGVGVPAAHLADLSVYPNPAHDAVTVDFGAAAEGKAVLEVFDITGRLVSSGEFPAGTLKARIGTESWLSGTYLFRLRIGQNIYRRMIVRD